MAARMAARLTGPLPLRLVAVSSPKVASHGSAGPGRSGRSRLRSRRRWPARRGCRSPRPGQVSPKPVKADATQPRARPPGSGRTPSRSACLTSSPSPGTSRLSPVPRIIPGCTQLAVLNHYQPGLCRPPGRLLSRTPGTGYTTPMEQAPPWGVRARDACGGNNRNSDARRDRFSIQGIYLDSI